jgi:pimeloyl-ACP methyl ester carboxylesterase
MGERVVFRSSTGPNLAGIIEVPDGVLRGWGVFAHGFTLGKDCPAAARICKQLAADGIGMLRFDALGLVGSEGDWGDGSFTVKVDDIVKACEFMANRATPAEILVGHSWGGAAVLAAARQSPGVRSVVTVTCGYATGVDGINTSSTSGALFRPELQASAHHPSSPEGEPSSRRRRASTC